MGGGIVAVSVVVGYFDLIGVSDGLRQIGFG
jgi:hypothetical protein